MSPTEATPARRKPPNAGKGRVKGSLNKATASIKALAQPYSADAIATLAAIMHDTTAPPPSRVAAASALLDRAHGKPAQALTGADDAPLIPPAIVYELHPRV